jgi:hypothetical protein
VPNLPHLHQDGYHNWRLITQKGCSTRDCRPIILGMLVHVTDDPDERLRCLEEGERSFKPERPPTTACSSAGMHRKSLGNEVCSARRHGRPGNAALGRLIQPLSQSVRPMYVRPVHADHAAARQHPDLIELNHWLATDRRYSSVEGSLHPRSRGTSTVQSKAALQFR